MTLRRLILSCGAAVALTVISAGGATAYPLPLDGHEGEQHVDHS